VRGGISPGLRSAARLSPAIVAGLAIGVTVAWAGVPPVQIVAMDNNFVDNTPTSPEGNPMLFDNDGNSTHNVTAVDDGPDGKALFRTGNVAGLTADRPIGGVEFLSSVDTYDFVCTIHPSEMTGTLTVTDSPAGPAPRPSIDLKVKSKKLEKVVKSGKLKVKVTAREPTDADGVTLTAKQGAKRITKKAKLNVNAGDSKTAKLKLKKSALEKLADLEKAKVKVAGDVDFGFGDKASKKLR
jgi:hypothetical protein